MSTRMTQLDLFEHADLPRPLTCPACGYSTTATLWSVRMFHGWSENGEPCISMELTRNHVLSMLREGRNVVNERHRKGKEPSGFEETIRHAIGYWGEAARDFIPAEHWPTEND